MKRLAAGIVLFILSFSVPAPGAANLVFFSPGLGDSLNKIEQVPVRYSAGTPAGGQSTAKAVLQAGPIDVAAQQFSGEFRSDSRLTLAPSWLGFAQPGQADSAEVQGQLPVPSAADLFEWLMVMAGFALIGVAIRNRSNSSRDDRPGFSRLPLDI